MLFTSFSFILFFIVAFILYWLVFNTNEKKRNVFLLFCNYVFYAFCNWKYLLIVILLSIFDYWISKKIAQKKKSILYFSIFIHVLLLGFFKYFNFFVTEFSAFLNLFGFKVTFSTLNIIIPLGISFYTFLSISYLLDVYNGVIQARKDALELFVSLSFFPIIYAGPIHRPGKLIPQLKENKIFQYGVSIEALRLILWGFFKKVMIADMIAPNVDHIFETFHTSNASMLVCGGVFFSIQIYADFSGYTDIARGISKLLGINIMDNFNYPYFSKNIADFWKRWHISLTQWFRDYIFLPFSYAISKKIQSDLIVYSLGIVLTWTITGLWHGANWTFVLWGIVHAALLIHFQIVKKWKKKVLIKTHFSVRFTFNAFELIMTYMFIVLAWILFRSETISGAVQYIGGLFDFSLIGLAIPKKRIIGLIVFFMILDFLFMRNGFDKTINRIPKCIRLTVYGFAVTLLLLNISKGNPFIYSQF